MLNVSNYQTSVPGDHVIKALATDERGITGYADPIYIRIIPPGGKVFRLISSGAWSDGNHWRDSQGNSGVPGANVRGGALLQSIKSVETLTTR